MLVIYGVYFLLFCFCYRIVLTIKKYSGISPELRQIPSLPLVQNIKWTKGYITHEPFLHLIRNYLTESLNEKGIIKVNYSFRRDEKPKTIVHLT